MDIDAVYTDVQSKDVAISKELETGYWVDRVLGVNNPDGFVITIAKTVEQGDMEHVEKVMRGEVERN